jgi:PAS domain S-box-containing protein
VMMNSVEISSFSANELEIFLKLNLDLYCIVSSRGMFSKVSPLWESTLGYSNAEFMQYPIQDLMHPDERDWFQERFWNTGDQDRPSNFTCQLLGKDGAYRLLEWNIKPDGEQVYAFARDITERGKIMQELTESEIRHRLLFENMNSGFALHEIITDSIGNPVDYRFLEVNQQFENLTGLNAKDLIGKKVLEVLPETEIYWIELYGKVAITGQPIRFDNYSNALGKHYQVSAFSPKKGQFATIFTDITHTKKVEEELRKAKGKAEESDRLKSSFLANMSHEIRTPMNGIIGFADLIQNPAITDEKRQHYAEVIKKSGKNLLNLINDLLDISKIESCQMTLNESTHSVDTLIKEVHQFFEAKLEADPSRQIQLQSSVSNQGLDSVTLDFFRLKQILMNLVDNAIKYTEAGIVQISCEIQEGSEQLWFSVSDSGIGLSPENKKMIFERFRQADNNISRIYGGTGLGLSICKGLVELMGGKIWVESNLGHGSTFRFVIPFKQPVKTENEN